jgi:AmmeMemoRadiSam system protein A
MTSDADRKTLLSIARSAIREALEGRRPRREEVLPADTPRPEGSGGVFVTLKSRGRLRGCIGLLRSGEPIDRTVAEMARSAAFSDPRFPPLREDELDGLSIEISRLSEFRPIAPEEVEVGTHGLFLRAGGRSGLLLPQVPEEQGWDRQAFLSGLCRKAGLPDGSWSRPGAVLEGFTAEVFGED